MWFVHSAQADTASKPSRVAISPDDHSMGRFQSIFEGRGSGSVISMVLVDSLEVAWPAMRANCHNRRVRLPSEFALRIRSEEHTSELQSLMRISYAVFCLKKKKRLTRLVINKNH